MKKAKSKFISLLLIVVMLLNFLPASASATVSDADAQTSTGVTTVPNPDYVEPGSVRELESRREENVKHFLLPDNTVQAVVYADAVHRMDDSGNWQDISNDLSLTEYKGVKFYTTADGRVVFAEKFAPNTQLWQLSENGYSIAMGMAQLQLSADATVTPVGGVTVTNAPVRRSATTWHSVEEARVVDNTASIVYSNVKTNTDLEYIMIGNDIKENIVVKSRSNSYTYQFNITLTGLTAVLNENGSISLTDSVTGQQQYTIPAPYMVDAAGERSNAVIYALKQTGEGQYTLTVTADSTWINADDRAFPVKIDPTVSKDSYMDTFISPDYPSTSFANYSFMWLKDDHYVYFGSGFPVLPAGSEIISASLVVWYYYQDAVTTGNLRATVHMVTENWTASTFTWNVGLQMNNFGLWPTAQGYHNLPGTVGAYINTPAKAEINIKNIAKLWQNGSPNYGVALKRYTGDNPWVNIKSAESSAQYRPYYTVTYTEPRLADGVYLLQNVGSNLYLEVYDGSYEVGAAVHQKLLANEDNLRNQLFKITFLETVDNNNYYSIRPMTNSGLGLYAPIEGNMRDVSIAPLPTESYNNNLLDRMWCISREGMQYTLKNGDDTQGGYLASQGNSELMQAHTISSVNDYSKWRLINYTGDTLEGVVLTPKIQTILVGQTADIDAVVYSSIPGVIGPPVFSVCNLDGSATNKATIDPTTGMLTALELGEIKVCVTFEGAINPWSFTVTIAEYYSFEVKHYYDHGYDVLIYNVLNDNAPEQIAEIQAVCTGILRKLFGVRVIVSIETYTSCADECKGTVTNNNFRSPCVHNPSHVTRWALKEDAVTKLGIGNDTMGIVTWCGHDMINEHEVDGYWQTEQIITLTTATCINYDTNALKTNAEIRADKTFSVLHELSHQLGALDHYCNGDEFNGPGNPCGNTNCYKCWRMQDEPQCVMNAEDLHLREKLLNGDLSTIYCAECLGTGERSIARHLMNHH